MAGGLSRSAVVSSDHPAESSGADPETCWTTSRRDCIVCWTCTADGTSGLLPDNLVTAVVKIETAQSADKLTRVANDVFRWGRRPGYRQAVGAIAGWFDQVVAPRTWPGVRWAELLDMELDEEEEESMLAETIKRGNEMQVTTQAQGTRTDRVAVESGEHSDQAVNTADEGLGARIARLEDRMMDVRERLAEINGELRTTTVALDALREDFRALAFRRAD